MRRLGAIAIQAWAARGPDAVPLPRASAPRIEMLMTLAGLAETAAAR